MTFRPEDRVGARLPRPCLMLVTGRRLAGGEDALLHAVDAAVEGGVNAVQVREKDLEPARLVLLAARVRAMCADRALVIVNGDAGVARECGADGVHLPEDAPWPASVPETMLVGRSVHSVEAAERAAAEGARYLIAGPVYETRSHPGRAASGVELIRRICEAVESPVIGIGGIDYQRAATVVRAGASGVAVISAVLAAPSPRDAASRLWGAVAEAFREAEAAR